MKISILLIPLLGTTLGAAMVYFMKNKISANIEKSLLGFASGVMIAASVWSLIIPSIELAQAQSIIPWLPATTGFLLGIAFLFMIDAIVPKLYSESECKSKTKALSKTTMLIIAVTIHNIPEGMAVGITLSGALDGDTPITLAGALALSIGIAVQNFPEGAIISMPLYSQGTRKNKCFLMGFLSGIVEPVSAVFTAWLTFLIEPFMPYFLSFAGGAMMYVVVSELIPEAQSEKDSGLGTLFIALGFSIMMILDVALG